MRTPIRDQLGLNDPTAGAAGGYTAEEIVSLRAQKLAQAEMRAALRAGLSTLPAPENEYSIGMPEVGVCGCGRTVLVLVDFFAWDVWGGACSQLCQQLPSAGCCCGTDCLSMLS
jgi:hypothetical protein